MKDVLVDQNGDLRCPQCHGRNFERKRTKKAKAGLGVVVLPAALLAPKRMKCLQCNTYSKTGSAQSWRDPALVQHAAPSPAVPTAPRPVDAISGSSGEGLVPLVAVGASTSASAVLTGVLAPLMPDALLEDRQRVAAAIHAGQHPVIGWAPPRDVDGWVAFAASRGLTLRAG